jgi:multicomponent Na+:H+ antiporter subunit G
VTVQAAVTVVLGLAAAAFFLAGTVGLLRFPDLHSRLHALTKADNVGLGLLVGALAVHAGSAQVAAKLLVVWLLALHAGAGSSYVLARGALSRRAGEGRGDA